MATPAQIKSFWIEKRARPLRLRPPPVLLAPRAKTLQQLEAWQLKFKALGSTQIGTTSPAGSSTRPSARNSLQEMGGEAVPQRMRRCVLLDPGRLRSRVAGAGKLTRGDRLEWIAAREQPAPRAANQPPIAQQIKQPRRQHCVAILAALALLDPDHHPRAVDIAPGAAANMRPTSSELKMTGALRGSRATGRCLTMSG